MKSAYSVGEVARIEKTAFNRGIKSALDGILNATCITLLDKYGMSKEQTNEVMTDVRKLFDEISENYLSLNDIKETLKNEYDVEIVLT